MIGQERLQVVGRTGTGQGVVRKQPSHSEMFYSCMPHISVLLKCPSFKCPRKNPVSLLGDMIAVHVYCSSRWHYGNCLAARLFFIQQQLFSPCNTRHRERRKDDSASQCGTGSQPDPQYPYLHHLGADTLIPGCLHSLPLRSRQPPR